MWSSLVLRFLLIWFPVTFITHGQYCSYKFQVWEPNENVLEKLLRLENAIHNLTFSNHIETLKAQNALLLELYRVKNSTADLERKLLYQELKWEDYTTKLEFRQSSRSSRPTPGLSNNPSSALTSGSIRYEDFRALKRQISQLHGDWISLKRTVTEIKLQYHKIRADMDTLEKRMVQSDWRSRRNSQQYGPTPDANRLDGSMNRTPNPTRRPDLSWNRPTSQNRPETRTNALDCHDIWSIGHRVSGVYEIKPIGMSTFVPVYCYLTASGGWTVIQRRIDGSQDFNQLGNVYRYGFGNLYGEFWAGNELIHRLTVQSRYSLWIDIWDWEGNRYKALYDLFQIANKSNSFRLRIEGYRSKESNAGDSLRKHDEMMFSTYDNDRDASKEANCAQDYQSGWWFNQCFSSNLNGPYQSSSQATGIKGIIWYSLKKNNYYSLKKVEMKIQPTDYL